MAKRPIISHLRERLATENSTQKRSGRVGNLYCGVNVGRYEYPALPFLHRMITEWSVGRLLRKVGELGPRTPCSPEATNRFASLLIPLGQ